MSRRKDEISRLKGTNFFQLAKRERDVRMHARLLALGHLESGKTKTEVVDMFKIRFPTLREWLTRFIAEGVEGLRDKPGKGRKRKLSAEKEEEFRQEVERLQEKLGGGRVRGQDVQVLLEEKFCIEHALPSVYHVLERCGLSWMSARSKHPKSDPAVQEDFKKNSKKKLLK